MSSKDRVDLERQRRQLWADTYAAAVTRVDLSPADRADRALADFDKRFGPVAEHEKSVASALQSSKSN